MSDTLRELIDDERAQNMAMPWYIYAIVAGIGLAIVALVVMEMGVALL